ncbi:hypothetical protein ABZ915_01920 [Streptomyces sp. NPDC046915]|uniref:hypothetical protein n=1 Tax=Streptomyces sp. NPDC046915 TaxID=3155257 RepID=UPI0034007D6A
MIASVMALPYGQRVRLPEEQSSADGRLLEIPARRTTVLSSAAAIAALATLVVGCAGEHSDSRRSPRTPSPAASSRAVDVPGVSVTKAPALLEGEVLAQAADAGGNREMDVRGGIRPGVLSVLVTCQGKGRLTVSVEPVGLRFPLDCVDGRAGSVLNQLEVKRAHEHGTVSVTAPAGVRWALTVGR